MSLAKSLHASSRALFKVTPQSLAVAAASAPPSSSSAASFRDNTSTGVVVLRRSPSGVTYSQSRTMTTSQRHLAAVEGTFRIEKDTFGELKVSFGRRARCALSVALGLVFRFLLLPNGSLVEIRIGRDMDPTEGSELLSKPSCCLDVGTVLKYKPFQLNKQIFSPFPCSIRKGSRPQILRCANCAVYDEL